MSRLQAAAAARPLWGWAFRPVMSLWAAASCHPWVLRVLAVALLVAVPAAAAWTCAAAGQTYRPPGRPGLPVSVPAAASGNARRPGSAAAAAGPDVGGGR